MKYRLTATCIWDEGQRLDSKGFKHQEDSIYPSFGQLTEEDRLFILCDGMGGHDAGEVASHAVCSAMSRSILDNDLCDKSKFSAEEFESALEAAYTELDLKDTGAEKKMGTTLAFLKLFEKGAFIAHMGDSRVYHIRPGKSGEETEILHVTHDHSLINDLLKAEVITEKEARTSNKKNVITRAMQPGNERRQKAEIYLTSDIKTGDYFYLCSDGMLEDPEMEDGTLIRNIFSDACGDIKKKTEILAKVTEKNRDNHSAFLIKIIEVMDDSDASTSNLNVSTETGNKELITLDKPVQIQEKDEKEGLISMSGLPKRKVGNHNMKLGMAIGVILVIVCVFLVRSCKDKDNNVNDINIENHIGPEHHIDINHQNVSDTTKKVYPHNAKTEESNVQVYDITENDGSVISSSWIPESKQEPKDSTVNRQKEVIEGNIFKLKNGNDDNNSEIVISNETQKKDSLNTNKD